MCTLIARENTNYAHISCDIVGTAPVYLFIGRVLYSPISHSNEQRLHILYLALTLYLSNAYEKRKVKALERTIYNIHLENIFV